MGRALASELGMGPRPWSASTLATASLPAINRSSRILATPAEDEEVLAREPNATGVAMRVHQGDERPAEGLPTVRRQGAASAFTGPAELT